MRVGPSGYHLRGGNTEDHEGCTLTAMAPDVSRGQREAPDLRQSSGCQFLSNASRIRPHSRGIGAKSNSCPSALDKDSPRRDQLQDPHAEGSSEAPKGWAPQGHGGRIPGGPTGVQLSLVPKVQMKRLRMNRSFDDTSEFALLYLPAKVRRVSALHPYIKHLVAIGSEVVVPERLAPREQAPSAPR